MSGGESDLSGRWTGFYNMPHGGPPTSFDAELRDTAGSLSGTTSEQGDTIDCLGQTLHAVLEGRRDGDLVTFTKRYDYLPRAHYAIDYAGQLTPDGNEIEGRWTIPGDWSGTFLMVRASGCEETIERKVSEEVR